ncbi:MAG: M48 family metallopeptidase [Clostridia bacterium]|nr:M48 family metallopeptidase [Clostridia bacterium]
MLSYTIKRMRRKTLSAYVLDNGNVEVRAPYSVSDDDIEKFIAEKEDTLKRYIDEQLKRQAQKNSFVLDIGSTLLFLGKECKIEYGTKTQLLNDTFYVTQGNIKNQVVALYKLAAQKIITERVEYLSKHTGLSYSSVKINSARSRWGSCSAKKALNFSWFLIMASPHEIDYVIIHELSHTKHMNHSSRFWDEVAKYVSDYKECRKNLNSIARRLQVENW